MTREGIGDKPLSHSTGHKESNQLGLDGIDADVDERATWSRRWRISRERRKKDLCVLEKLAVGEEARFGESYFQRTLCSLRNKTQLLKQ